ncbi:MAG: HDOD domain-containing protein [Acidimicrobiia bacterium]
MPGRQTRELIELTPQPSVAAALLAGVEHGPIDLERLIRLIEADPALTVRVLRHANSIQHGAPRRVASVPHAMSLLGSQTVTSLVMAAAVASLDAVGPTGPPGHWRHRLVTAVCAGAIASELSVPPAEAHAAGLLHDVGTLLLFQQSPDRLAECQREGPMARVLSAEINAFGVSHTMIGASTLEHWCFPAALIEAVACHHGADEPHHQVGRIVRVAEVIALSMQADPNHHTEIEPESAMAMVRLSHGRLPSIKRRVEARLHDIARLLSVRPVPAADPDTSADPNAAADLGTGTSVDGPGGEPS